MEQSRLHLGIPAYHLHPCSPLILSSGISPTNSFGKKYWVTHTNIRHSFFMKQLVILVDGETGGDWYPHLEL